MTRKVYIIQPFDSKFNIVYSLIKSAISFVSSDLDGNDIEVYRLDESSSAGQSIIGQLYDTIENTDLIICDLSNSIPNVMYQLGYAHGIKKPVILISQKPDYLPFDIRTVQVIYYDISLKSNKEFMHKLGMTINDALKNPSAYNTRPTVETSVNSVFISYSHQDRSFLDRLMIHLRPLEKEGIIDSWIDTRLQAGDKWKVEVEHALNSARVAILLVSADFLASDFIVDNELPPILLNAESKGTRIIPVILKPCRFKRDKNLSLFQAINDPANPLSTLPESEQELVYDNISESVERLLVR